MTDTTEAHYRLLEKLYLAAPINRFYLPTITIADGTCDIGIEARKEMYHAAATIHGSIYFKMLDDAAFFAANSLVPDYFVLTASFHLHMIRPMPAGPIRASGRIVRYSPRLSVAEAVLYGPDGREAGRGSGDFMPSKVKLEDCLSFCGLSNTTNERDAS